MIHRPVCIGWNDNMLAQSQHYSLDCIRQGIFLYWRTLGKARGIEIHTGDIEYVISNTRRGPERIYNLRLSLDIIDRQIDEMIAGIRASRMPDNLLLAPGTKPDNLSQILVLKGFSIDTSGLCMALELPGLPIPKLEKDAVGVTAVQDPVHLRQWSVIVLSQPIDGTFDRKRRINP